MDQEFITRHEHEEFTKYMDSENKRRDDENKRQNKRIDALEESFKEINRLALSTERIAASIQSLTTELTKQGERLESIESKPGKRWDALISGIIGAIAAAVGAAIVAGIIH
ncbi:hypothetical protein [Eisenbergiella massiliensis]|uniref:hypothetical protein n=1 Tax=Eisenbergiella massiliensis TaxID=1720294 RepID=UPI0023F416E2|nr:hypothetical protein [Eisenbergiella massiliensis]